MLFSEAVGRPVLSTETAVTVGTVGGFLVDPVTASVLAVRLKKGPGRGVVLHWQDLTAFGTDSVTIATATLIGEARDRAAELAGGSAELLGKRLLTDAGTELGTVTDVEFNEASGAVVALVTADGPVYGERLLGCGSYAVIVKDS